MLDRMLYSLTRPLIKVYSRLMLKMDVHWHAALPEGPKIFAANHPSCTDPFLVPILVSHRVSILITENAFNFPLFGHYLRKTGHIPVGPGRGKVVMEAARRLLDNGRSIAIFPEGTLSPREGGFRRPRTGAARLALSTGAPIVPIGIHLVRNRMWNIKSKIKGKNTSGDWYLRGPYHMTVGTPLYFQGSIEDREFVVSVSERIMQSIISLAQQSQMRMQALQA